jgi:hypothetical protein
MNLKTIRDRCTEDGDCWIWQQGVNSAGHPQARVYGKSEMVRRHALVESGKEPYGRYKRVTDTCGNRLCCNPAHLKWACQADIVRAAYRAGKRNTASEYLSRVCAVQKTGFAKLDWKRALEIRARADEPTRLLAKEYGVGVHCINNIKANRSWKVASPWA